MGRLAVRVFSKTGVDTGADAARAGAAAELRLATGPPGGRVIFGTIISQRAVELADCTPEPVPTTSSATGVRGSGAGTMGASVKEGEGSGLNATSDADSRAVPLM